MKMHTQKGDTSCDEARNLLSVAYKNVVGSRRSSWRVVSSIASKETDTGKKQRCQDYLKKIVKELDDICAEVLVRLCVVWVVYYLTGIVSRHTLVFTILINRQGSAMVSILLWFPVPSSLGSVSVQ